jgi:hypothetical protein
MYFASKNRNEAMRGPKTSQKERHGSHKERIISRHGHNFNELNWSLSRFSIHPQKQFVPLMDLLTIVLNLMQSPRKYIL